MLRVLDLFSGIGGMSLGLERAGGFETVGFCEIDPFCRRVLAKHWPNVWCHDDIRTLTADIVRERCGRVDLVCGGFPCQDISIAGFGVGIDGDRSGLWAEMCRLVRDLRPHFAIVENVAALLGRGMGRVLGDLAEIGFDAEWSMLSACAMGAPHTRERVFIVAHTLRERPVQGAIWAGAAKAIHPERTNNPQWSCFEPAGTIGDAGLVACARDFQANNGLPGWMDHLKAYGNAVVPQVVEAIGRAILAAGMEETR